jgi:hypothetical protein
VIAIFWLKNITAHLLAIYFTFFYFGILQPKYWATLIVLT